MKIKILFLSILSSFLVFSAHSQTIGKNLDNLAKDPSTAQNAAKADVYILGHKIAADNVQKDEQPTALGQKQKRKHKYTLFNKKRFR